MCVKRLSVFLIFFLVSIVPGHLSGQVASSISTAEPPAWKDLVASMYQMHEAMASSKPSGNTDLDFVRLMLPHHQAAVDMAKVLLLHGNDPQMRRLAQEIIAEQQSEIDLMELWLKKHDSSPGSPAQITE